jgi:hypothetical protein
VRFAFIVYGIALTSGRPLLARGGASITSEVFPRFEMLNESEGPSVSFGGY